MLTSLWISPKFSGTYDLDRNAGMDVETSMIMMIIQPAVTGRTEFSAGAVESSQ
jgi:hypothetical protein